MRTPAATLALLLISGCSAVPSRLSESPVPPDFALEVRDFSSGAGALFIVEPDGVFRAATGAPPVEQIYPPATRRLSTQQMATLWEAVDGLGDATEAPVAVSTTAAGRRRTLRVDPATDADAARLMDELRRLAWVGR